MKNLTIAQSAITNNSVAATLDKVVQPGYKFQSRLDVTKVDCLYGILEYLATGKTSKAGVAFMVEFVAHEIDLLEGRAERAATKKTVNQRNNDELKKDILSVLSNDGMLCSDVITALAWNDLYSVAKVSSLLRQLKLEGKVDSYTEKSRSYFVLA